MDAGNVSSIICPDCGAELAPRVETCQACGGATAKHQAVGSRDKLQQLLNRPWVIVVLVLHVGFLGIPLYWKTKYSLGVRLMIVVASIVYTVGAVTFIVVMLRWLWDLTFGG